MLIIFSNFDKHFEVLNLIIVKHLEIKMMPLKLLFLQIMLKQSKLIFQTAKSGKLLLVVTREDSYKNCQFVSIEQIISTLYECSLLWISVNRPVNL